MKSKKHKKISATKWVDIKQKIEDCFSKQKGQVEVDFFGNPYIKITFLINSRKINVTFDDLSKARLTYVRDLSWSKRTSRLIDDDLTFLLKKSYTYKKYSKQLKKLKRFKSLIRVARSLDGKVSLSSTKITLSKQILHLAYSKLDNQHKRNKELDLKALSLLLLDSSPVVRKLAQQEIKKRMRKQVKQSQSIEDSKLTKDSLQEVDSTTLSEENKNVG